eukprot:4554571-Pleurochrysis_carterae.AAC.2
MALSGEMIELAYSHAHALSRALTRRHAQTHAQTQAMPDAPATTHTHRQRHTDRDTDALRNRDADTREEGDYRCLHFSYNQYTSRVLTRAILDEWRSHGLSKP